ncbi:DUF4249 family protein [Polaribacter sp.]|uniref:DUF4249 family protein n=1 Tax=Polaribacter sp. TaxID=1920175 RepID=UPI003F6D3B2A
MKKTYILPILFVFLFSKCEKVIEVDVPSIEPKLIIDATFQVYFDENPVSAKTTVKLSESADYFAETIPTVTNATVFLTNLSDNSVIDFTDNDADGEYEPINSFIPADGIEYELTVIHNNETYKGKATKVKSTRIIEVNRGDGTLFSGNEVEINVKIQDELGIDNYYYFDFSNNNYSVLEDRFFDGQEYEVPNFYSEDDIILPTAVNIRMLGISKDYFTYLQILVDQSGQDGGGPFETVPTSLLGNVVNTTNTNNFPLGYFHISETDTFTIFLDKEEE